MQNIFGKLLPHGQTYFLPSQGSFVSTVHVPAREKGNMTSFLAILTSENSLNTREIGVHTFLIQMA